ncbi:helix-turn-helix domain-containing protein [Streptomyces sp. NPDC004284]|uniref:helix-turn-helix domain-containing protein n=1 Tax=Streptomyces sp. NPDC004284 TaxID=3364695 RepID=UPI0036A0F163
MSRYSERRDNGRPDRGRTITDLTVTVLEPGPEQPPLPKASRDDRYTVTAQRRRHRILALLQDDPTRLWRPAEIAARFGDITLHTMYRQLSRWAKTGLIHTLGPGPYTATDWTSPPLPPAEIR